MKNGVHLVVGFSFAFSLCGCTAGDSAGHANAARGGDGSAVVPDAAVTPDAAVGSDTPVDCRPEGTWVLGYTLPGGVDGGLMCWPASDMVVIDADEKGALQVKIAGLDQVRDDSCGPGPPRPGTLTHEVSFDVAACRLDYAVHSRWCTSGEGQCEGRTLSLRFDGDRAEGSATSARCWCPGFSPTRTDLRASARRQ